MEQRRQGMSIPDTGARVAEEVPVQERRATPRHRALKGATLKFNRGFGAFECVVRNLSEGGARLTFGDPLGVPTRFDLRIGPDGEWRPAQVRWRGASDVGVTFVEA
jgi:hypothetical protein